MIISPPVFQTNGGGALCLLRRSLRTPTVQTVGMVMIGDSITWGLTLPDNAGSSPRDGTLSDPRNTFAPSSWVNEFKRWIGGKYAAGITPMHTNWPTSPSGEAVTEWVIPEVYEFTGRIPFVTTITGGSTDANVEALAGSVTGFVHHIRIGGPTSTVDLDFVMTGTKFELVFSAVAGDVLADVELFTDGVSRGTTSLAIGTTGVVAGSGNKLLLSFPYIRAKQVRLRFKSKPGSSTLSRCRVEAVNFPKTIRITNQGINGQSARSYPGYNLAGNANGDGVAVGPQDEFIFVQLGTNDRSIRTDVPTGTSAFRANYRALLEALTPLGNVITMVANKTALENPTTQSFTMQDVRMVVQGEAKRLGLPCIDNYIIFDRLDLACLLADGLHPNEAGHALIARNVIGAMETA